MYQYKAGLEKYKVFVSGEQYKYKDNPNIVKIGTCVLDATIFGTPRFVSNKTALGKNLLIRSVGGNDIITINEQDGYIATSRIKYSRWAGSAIDFIIHISNEDHIDYYIPSSFELLHAINYCAGCNGMNSIRSPYTLTSNIDSTTALTYSIRYQNNYNVLYWADYGVVPFFIIQPDMILPEPIDEK